MTISLKSHPSLVTKLLLTIVCYPVRSDDSVFLTTQVRHFEPIRDKAHAAFPALVTSFNSSSNWFIRSYANEGAMVWLGHEIM